ncbi:MAG TPA: sugar phosphate isomerase/epimerase [Gemmataceae bacterium]|nr:sugar phosphate isomerase/epimerase [Gemmataceae bacterium]
MARPVILFSQQWTDLPLEELVRQAGEWGYQGLELACWGDHFEVQRAVSEQGYCQQKLDLLTRADLSLPVLSCHQVGQAVCDRVDGRHQQLLPDYVWGDGDPSGVRQRAVEEVMATVRAAQELGVTVVSGFTGSPLWSYVAGYPRPTASVIADGYQEFAAQWHPILDVCRECGVRFAAEIHPGQMAFDLYTAEMSLDALDGREEFGFTLDPSHFLWQGVDPVEFIRRFPERIYHVHVKDAALTLNGRSGLLNSYLPHGDARRGWDFRAPGRGGIDWEGLIRALHAANYQGPLSVEWKDCSMNREQGAEEACKFVKRLDFEPAPGVGQALGESG